MSPVMRLMSRVAAAFVAVVVLTGCPEKGPAEKAGEKIDEAVEEVGDALD